MLKLNFATGVAIAEACKDIGAEDTNFLTLVGPV
jgi:hypothetical protein